MTESDVWQVIISTLRAGLDLQGFNNVEIRQSYQPIKTGVSTNPTAYLFKVTSQRVGWQSRKYRYNMGNDYFDCNGDYWIEATYQLTAQVERDINDINSLTSYDIADKCAAVLQTDESLNNFLVNGIGIQAITDVRNPFSLDDRDQFDQDASFDFVLSYNQEIMTTVPKADPIEPDIYRV